MKILGYVYDLRYYKCGENIYKPGVFDISVWDRFLESYDKIHVFGSIYEIEENEIEGLHKMNHPDVEYIHVDYIDTAWKMLKNMFIKNPTFKTHFPNVDAVVIRVPGQYSNNAFHVAKALKLKVGLEIVGCPFDSYWNYGNIQGKILAPINYYWMKYIVKHADFTLYVTKFFLQKKYPSLSANTTNASNVNISVELSGTDIKSRIATIKKNINKKKITLGISGSFDVKYKGHIEVLKALKILDSKFIVVEMIGPGDYSWVIELAKSLGVEKNIKVLGKLNPGEEVMNWLNTIDIYLQPSKQEGLPRSTIEALSQATPVLASSVAGIPELLDDKYLHTPGDYKQLAKQLGRVISHSEELEKMAISNFKTALNYDSKILSKRRKDFWNEFSKS